MSFDGRAASSSGWSIRPREPGTGSTGFAVRTRNSSLTGLYAMATAEHREPCESRGSCTVLGAPGGETPPGNSTASPIAGIMVPRRLDLRKHESFRTPCEPGQRGRARPSRPCWSPSSAVASSLSKVWRFGDQSYGPATDVLRSTGKNNCGDQITNIRSFCLNMLSRHSSECVVRNGITMSFHTLDIVRPDGGVKAFEGRVLRGFEVAIDPRQLTRHVEKSRSARPWPRRTAGRRGW